MATVPSARKRPPPSDVESTAFQTPRSRRRIIRDYMPVTPVSIPSRSAYVPSPRADALDALAAVACTTSPSTSLSPSPLIPHSPSLLSPNTAPTPSAPAATAAATSNWLSRLVESRPEVGNFIEGEDYEEDDDEEDDDTTTNNINNIVNNGDAEQHEKQQQQQHVNDNKQQIKIENNLNDDSINDNDNETSNIPDSFPSTTPSLKAIITQSKDWIEIVRNARRAVSRISQARGSVSDPERYARQASAVYYAAMDGLLHDESERLRGDSSKLSEKLIRNRVFHNSIMAFSWECAVAAGGRLDMRMLWMAMHVLQLSPFALTKVLEAFVKRFKDMPQPLKVHLMNCDARIVERRLWLPGSELVAVLSERAKASNNSVTHDDSSSLRNDGKWGDGILKKLMNSSSSDINNNLNNEAGKQEEKATMTVRAKDVVLQMVYKKVLGLASLRAQELLILLAMDKLAEDVWSCFKACIWQHWHIMVSRHLDQVIMCCIYGVAKVHRIDVKFREIVVMYRTMKHVREPSFTPLLPDVIRQVSLTSYSHLTGKGTEASDNAEAEKLPKWGDLIQFYNKVFIPSMKKNLLKLSTSNKNASKSSDVNGRPNIKLPKLVNLTNSNTNNSTTHPDEKEGGKTVTEGRTSTVLNGEEVENGNYKDALRDAVLQSPMRSLKSRGSVKRIGPITVGSMSPREAALVSLRQSPGRRAIGHTKVMTPGTRTLYAFGESPGMTSVRSTAVGNAAEAGVNGACLNTNGNPLISERKEDVQRQLSFDVQDMKEKSMAANLRKRIAGAFAGMSSRVRLSGSAKDASPQQRQPGETGEKD